MTPSIQGPLDARVRANALLWALPVLGLGFLVRQSDFPAIAGLFGVAFGAYWWLCCRADEADVPWLLAVAVMVRVALVPAFPALSDDVYRFVWDGRLLVQGHNPFDHLPSHYAAEGFPLPGLDAGLYGLLNSPDYFTVYPPLAQGVFALSCTLFPHSVYGSMVVMKLCLLCAEVGTLVLLWRLLAHLGLPRRRVLWYALNPLVVMEVCGNLHFEAAMVCLLLLGWWCLLHGQVWSGGVAVAGSVAAKLLPLLFMPMFLGRLPWRRLLGFYAVVGGVCGLLFLPLLNQVFFSHLGDSLQLYFRRFEFNASVFYVAKWAVKPYVPRPTPYIGPVLGMATFVGVWLIALLQRPRTWANLPTAMLWAVLLHMLLSTTVHPWYLIMPVALCIFTRYRAALVWSGMAVLSYSHYMGGDFQERHWLIGLEYAVVMGVMGWEGVRAWASRREKRA